MINIVVCELKEETMTWNYIKDIFIIISPFVLAFISVYIVNIKLFKSNKTSQLILDFLENISIEINSLGVLTRSYVDKHNSKSMMNNEASLIKSEIKRLQVKLNLNKETIDKSLKKNTYKVVDLIIDIRDLKKIITDDPFMQKNSYSENQKNIIYNKLEEIGSKLLQTKLEMYK